MSVSSPPEEFFMRRDIRDHGSVAEFAKRWKRHWMLVIVMLAVIIGLGILSTSILRAYGQSHYDYLTQVSASSRQAGFS
jgi:NADH:ubiquinone oxidoreductase subunit 4 (subunit M)